MPLNTDKSTRNQSVLASLRLLIPSRPLLFGEALRIAELQANRLRELIDCSYEDIGQESISCLPRIAVRYRDLPTSGLTYWDGHDWVIGLNRTEPETRQRFTLMHEFKHIIDHGRTGWLYTGNERISDLQQSERAADYFAGCLLMPKRHVKRLWGHGVQTPSALASYFGVSDRAMAYRIDQLGLLPPRRRCQPGRHSTQGVAV